MFREENFRNLVLKFNKQEGRRESSLLALSIAAYTILRVQALPAGFPNSVVIEPTLPILRYEQ
jgi:hypothetical protein